MTGFASRIVEKMMRRYGRFDSLGESPSVSVVMPAFDEAPYIDAAIKSALGQSYKGSVEVMVIDDGSTDGTGEIARRAGAKVYRTHNRGASAARNNGMHKANGDIVLFLDGDSEMPCNAIERAVSSVKNGYVAGSFARYSDDPTDNLFNYSINAIRGALTPFRNISRRIPLSASGPLIYARRDIAIGNGIYFNEDYKTKEDSTFLSEMSEHGSIGFIGDATVKTSARRSDGKSVLDIAAGKTRGYLNPFGNYGHVESKRRLAA